MTPQQLQLTTQLAAAGAGGQAFWTSRPDLQRDVLSQVNEDFHLAATLWHLMRSRDAEERSRLAQEAKQRVNRHYALRPFDFFGEELRGR
jgi:hypothetical protein